VIRAAEIISTEMPFAFAADGDRYRTVDHIDVVIHGVDQVLHWVTVPANYRFDGASIPRCLWSLIGSPFDPDLILAACVHDWYCDHTANCYPCRVIGDAVFFFLLTKAGVPRWRRVLMYLGVRLNSFWFYGRFEHGSPVNRPK
jgi:hypothetical protein